MRLTMEETVATKVAMIRKYIKARPAKGTPSRVLRRLMEYETELNELMRQEVGEYKHYPGSYWEPPSDELVNEDDVDYMTEQAVVEANAMESWEDLERDDLEEMMELMEDYEEVVQADYNSRMGNTVWGCI